MKKSLFILASLIAFGFTVSAQTEQGNFLVGGNVELNTAKKNTTISLTPSVGYFFVNNFAAGANLLLNYSKTGSADAHTTTFGIGPFARYYFGMMNIRPFLHADVDFLSTNTKIAAESSTSTGSTYFLAGGLAAFLNRNVALEGLAGYSHTAYAHQTGSGGFKLKIGFQVYINRAEVKTIAK